MCEECGIAYTINLKKNEYPEETKQLAIKMYYSNLTFYSHNFAAKHRTLQGISSKNSMHLY